MKNNENIELKKEEKEEVTEMLLTYENDFVAGLLAASAYKEETQLIQVARRGQLLFEFHIRALSESEYDKCKKTHTKYVRNKQLGMKLPEDTDTVKYRAALIYEATVDTDRESLWNNKKVWADLNVINPLDVIDACLLSGEKDSIIDAIDKLSGYDDNLEEVTKN